MKESMERIKKVWDMMNELTDDERNIFISVANLSSNNSYVCDEIYADYSEGIDPEMAVDLFNITESSRLFESFECEAKDAVLASLKESNKIDQIKDLIIYSEYIDGIKFLDADQDLDDSFLKIFVQKDSRFILTIKDPSDELVFIALEKNPELIKEIPQTEERCLKAIDEWKKAIDERMKYIRKCRLRITAPRMEVIKRCIKIESERIDKRFKELGC